MLEAVVWSLWVEHRNVAGMPLLQRWWTWSCIRLRVGIITRAIPPPMKGGNWKHTLFPLPVGCMTMACLPWRTACTTFSCQSFSWRWPKFLAKAPVKLFESKSVTANEILKLGDVYTMTEGQAAWAIQNLLVIRLELFIRLFYMLKPSIWL